LQNYRFTILGAGLAGLSLSVELSLLGIPHNILDTKSIGSGASGTPAGLLNPASAQKATFSAYAPNCISAFERLFSIVSQTVDCSNVILNTSILRPAIDDKLAGNFKDSVENGNWPEGWASWLTKEQLTHYGTINGLGGMLIHKGYALNFRKWTCALAAYTSSLYAEIVENADYSFEKIPSGYRFTCNNTFFITENIIDCTGASELYKSKFKWAAVKGQTRTVHCESSLTLNTAVSGYGYVVQSGQELVLGSTYEHHFTNIEPTYDKDQLLLKKASMVTDTFLTVTHITERWAGVRVSTPDRLPAIGSLPDETEFYYIFGLGSKGLYYSAWIATIMAQHITSNSPIPKAFHVKRLLKE
jgi:glycine oxidase